VAMLKKDPNTSNAKAASTPIQAAKQGITSPLTIKEISYS
jgi:hypothetical protein